MKSHVTIACSAEFTLIELLVVIAIIAILAGPACCRPSPSAKLAAQKGQSQRRNHRTSRRPSANMKPPTADLPKFLHWRPRLQRSSAPAAEILISLSALSQSERMVRERL